MIDNHLCSRMSECFYHTANNYILLFRNLHGLKYLIPLHRVNVYCAISQGFVTCMFWGQKYVPVDFLYTHCILVGNVCRTTGKCVLESVPAKRTYITQFRSHTWITSRNLRSLITRHTFWQLRHCGDGQGQNIPKIKTMKNPLFRNSPFPQTMNQTYKALPGQGKWDMHIHEGDHS